MEPLHLIRTMRRRWRPIVVLALVGVSLGVASSTVAEDAAPDPVPAVKYDACHTLLVDRTLSEIYETVDVSNLAQLAQRLTHGEIPAATASALGRDADEVASQVRVDVRNDTQSMSVCTVGATPTEAEAASDEFALGLIAFLETEAQAYHDERITTGLEQVTQSQSCKDDAEAVLAATRLEDPAADVRDQEIAVELCAGQLRAAQARLTEFQAAGVPVVPLESLERAAAVEISESTYDARLRQGAAGSNVEITAGEGAGDGTGAPESSSFGPALPGGPAPRGVAGALLGAMIGFGYVIFTERLDSKLRSKPDVEATLDLPVLAEIPLLSRKDRKSTRILTLEEPRSRTAESFRALRSALDYARRIDEDQGTARPGAQVVLVTSAGPSEGKTTTVANLATVLAEGDRRVLAINCDFRRPRLHRYLGGTSYPLRLNVTGVPGVQLVTQVTENDSDATPSDVIAAQRRLVQGARASFDVIILDTAPILTTNDATDLLDVADHVVLVVNSSVTRAESAARASELLERRGRAPLGVALVGAHDVPNASDYYYGEDDPYLEPTGRRRRQVVDLAEPEVEPVR